MFCFFSDLLRNDKLIPILSKRDPFHIIVLKVKFYEMGGCCTAQQLAIHLEKQLSLKNVEILKLYLYRNLT